jgi:hypothetical protein
MYDQECAKRKAAYDQERRAGESLGGLTQAAVVKQQGQVLGQIEMQERLIEQLHGSISALTDRINMVLLPDAPHGESTDKNKQIECQLAEAIRVMNDRLGMAIRNIQGIISRCEL